MMAAASLTSMSEPAKLSELAAAVHVVTMESNTNTALIAFRSCGGNSSVQQSARDWFTLTAVATVAKLDSEKALRKRLARRASTLRLRDDASMVWRPVGDDLRAVKKRGLVHPRAREAIMLSRECIEELVPELDMNLLPPILTQIIKSTGHGHGRIVPDSDEEDTAAATINLQLNASVSTAGAGGGGVGAHHDDIDSDSDSEQHSDSAESVVQKKKKKKRNAPHVAAANVNSTLTSSSKRAKTVTSVRATAAAAVGESDLDSDDDSADNLNTCDTTTQPRRGGITRRDGSVGAAAGGASLSSELESETETESNKVVSASSSTSGLTLAWKEKLVLALIRVYITAAKRNNVERAALCLLRTGKAGKRSGTANTRCSNSDLVSLRVFRETNVPVPGMGCGRSQICESDDRKVWLDAAKKIEFDGA